MLVETSILGLTPGVCSEVLPPTRSQRHRSLRFQPETGRLDIYRGKRITQYRLAEFPSRIGRAFRIDKLDGTGHYDLLIPRSGHVSCDCKGHTSGVSEFHDRVHRERSDTDGCVHVDAVKSLIQNGWL